MAQKVNITLIICKNMQYKTIDLSLYIANVRSSQL